ncbi:MAG: hypothetical protein V3V55_03255 [Rhodospirillales bacterium]
MKPHRFSLAMATIVMFAASPAFAHVDLGAATGVALAAVALLGGL